MLKVTPITPENGKLEGFELFWEIYPRKRAKLDALRAWEATKRTRPPIEAIIAAVRKMSELSIDKEFMPYPATWLRRGQWLDSE